MKQPIRKAIFPVGGLGTRLLPATKAVPKEMLPIVDKPLIQFGVEEALASGIEQIIFVTNREKSAIESYFDESNELSTILRQRGKEAQVELLEANLPHPGTISYARQPQPLGLGHAVWCARHFIGDEPFAVLLPDDLVISQTPCLQQMVQAYDSSMGSMVAVTQVPESEVDKYGILDVTRQEGHRIFASGMVEKPSPQQAPSQYAVVGRYILTPDVMKALGDNVEMGGNDEIQLTDAISKCVQGENLCGYLFEGSRYDCGSKEGLLEATLDFALSRDDLKGIALRVLEKRAVA